MLSPYRSRSKSERTGQEGGAVAPPSGLDHVGFCGRYRGKSQHCRIGSKTSLLTHDVTSRPSIGVLREALIGDESYLLWLDDFPRQIVPNTTDDASGYKLNFLQSVLLRKAPRCSPFLPCGHPSGSSQCSGLRQP